MKGGKDGGMERKGNLNLIGVIQFDREKNSLSYAAQSWGLKQNLCVLVMCALHTPRQHIL